MICPEMNTLSTPFTLGQRRYAEQRQALDLYAIYFLA